MQSTWVSLSFQKEIQFTDSQSMKSTGGTINIVNSSNYNTMLLLVVLFQSGETNWKEWLVSSRVITWIYLA